MMQWTAPATSVAMWQSAVTVWSGESPFSATSGPSGHVAGTSAYPPTADLRVAGWPRPASTLGAGMGVEHSNRLLPHRLCPLRRVLRALKVRQISPAQVLVDFPIIKGRAAVSIYPGIGTQAETGVRNGWYRAPDLNLRPSWAPFA